MSQPYRRFAANLARLREAAGLSREELALRARIDRAQLGLIEGGRGPVMLGTLIKLAGTLGVTLDDLLDGITWESSLQRPGRFVVEPVGGEGDDG